MRNVPTQSRAPLSPNASLRAYLRAAIEPFWSAGVAIEAATRSAPAASSPSHAEPNFFAGTPRGAPSAAAMDAEAPVHFGLLRQAFVMGGGGIGRDFGRAAETLADDLPAAFGTSRFERDHLAPRTTLAALAHLRSSQLEPPASAGGFAAGHAVERSGIGVYAGPRSVAEALVPSAPITLRAQPPAPQAALPSPSGGAEMRREIEIMARAALTAAVATSTGSAYNSHVRNYVAFCELYGYIPWPATYPSLSSWFTHYVCKRGLSANTLGNMLSALRNASREFVASFPSGAPLDGLDQHGLHITAIELTRLQRVMIGLKKLGATPVKHKLPVRRAILDRAEAAVRSGNGGVLPARDEAGLLMLRVAQACLLRVGEYTGVGTLLKNDVTELENGGLRLHLRECKTARPGEIQVVDLIEPALAVPLRAVLARRQAEQSVFMCFSKEGVETSLPASRYYVTTLLRQYLAATGVDAARYSSHSLRAGGATDLAHFGASWPDIMRKGRWISPKSPMAYVAAADDFSKRLAELVASHGALGPGSVPVASEQPAGVSGPSLLPWCSTADKERILRALLGELVPLLGQSGAAAVVDGFASLSDGAPGGREPVEQEEGKEEEEKKEEIKQIEPLGDAAAGAAPSYGQGGGAAAEAAADADGDPARARNEAADAPAAKRPRSLVVDRVQHHVATDAGWEAYEWAKSRFQTDWISAARHDTQRFRNKIADLRDLVTAGLAEATARADAAKVALWEAELELGRSASPFITSVD